MLFKAVKDGRVNAPVILEISPEVVFFEQTKFSDQNATKSGVKVSSSFELFNSLKFHLFQKQYFDLSEEDKSCFQAEVLVFKNIPLKYILNISSIS